MVRCPISQKTCLEKECGWWVTHHDEEGYEGCAMYVLGFQMNSLIDSVYELNEHFQKE